MIYLEVIIALPLEGTFSYTAEEYPKYPVGHRVIVPWGKKGFRTGIVAKASDQIPPNRSYNLKPVVGFVDSFPMISPHEIDFWQWIAKYYLCTLGEVMSQAIPSRLIPQGKAQKLPEPTQQLEWLIFPTRELHDAQELSRSPRQQKLWKTISSYQTGIRLDELRRQEAYTATVLKKLKAKGLVSVKLREKAAMTARLPSLPFSLHQLTKHQSEALEKIKIGFTQTQRVLLHGLNASGKTEIFKALIDETLQEGHDVLYLLPEVALTDDTVQRLKETFGEYSIIYHSKIAPAQRTSLWLGLRKRDSPTLIIGTRSALFLPFYNLGLIVVDEEHDVSFKQADPAPRFHARDVAVMLGTQLGANVLLGSATPSFESYFNALKGKYTLVELLSRYHSEADNQILITRLKHKEEESRFFSKKLLDEMRRTLSNREQILILFNRRGFATQLECVSCHSIATCPNCHVSLVFHKAKQLLNCRICGWTHDFPYRCTECKETQWLSSRFGIERVKEELRRLFPLHSIEHLDGSTPSQRQKEILASYSHNNISILLGTQIIAKGFDFCHVSLAVIALAEQFFRIPDFRAYEHFFQIATQLSGRAGRRGKQGKIMIQTYSLGHPALQNLSLDYKKFFHKTIEERKQFGYPPFGKLVRVIIKHINESICHSTGQQMVSALQQYFPDRVMGLILPEIDKVRGMFLREVHLKFLSASIEENKATLQKEVQRMMSLPEMRKGRIVVDVDPF